MSVSSSRRFFVGVCGGNEAHIHAADLVDLIVLDLREDRAAL